MSQLQMEQCDDAIDATIISFIGTTPNIGTTVVALRHCFHIAQFTMSKVLYLCFNLKSSKLKHYFGVEEDVITLDDVLPGLKNKQFSINHLKQVLYQPTKKFEVFFLFGNKQREIAEQYLAEDLLELINLARPHFEYIIIDANSYWDNAGSFIAMQSANHTVVTTTDARSHFQEDYQKWFGALMPHLSLPYEQLYLLLLRQKNTDQHYSFKEIVAETATTPYLDSQLPLSLFSYLDRGSVLDWLLSDPEAKYWLSESCHLLINPAHLSLLPISQHLQTKLYWPWQKRQKATFTEEVGGVV